MFCFAAVLKPWDVCVSVAYLKNLMNLMIYMTSEHEQCGIAQFPQGKAKIMLNPCLEMHRNVSYPMLQALCPIFKEMIHIIL